MTDPRIRHALAYPFEGPDDSFVFAAGRALPLAGSAEALNRLNDGDLVPVLVSGSNAAPSHLARKVSAIADYPAIPVLRGTARDVAAVHSCHFAGYGAIPATVMPRDGATTTLFCTFLAPSLLPVMHRSETLGRNYDFLRLDGVAFDTHGATIAAPHAYVSRHGCLGWAGEPVGVLGVPCDDPALTARPQAELLAQAHALLAPDIRFETFVLRLIENTAARARAGTALKRATGLPLSVPARWRHAA